MNTAALFDLDGVVVDTESQYTLFWNEVGKRDFPDIPDFALKVKGQTLFEIYQKYYPGDVVSQHRIDKELNDFEARMQYVFVSGVEHFVEELKSKVIHTAVVTSSNHAKMESLYAAVPEIRNMFDHIFTAEDATASKPAPDCYIHAAESFGLRAADCFVFEDSFNGLRSGMSSGATVIGLTTSNPQSAIKEYCHYCIDDFSAFTVEEMLNLKN